MAWRGDTSRDDGDADDLDAVETVELDGGDMNGAAPPLILDGKATSWKEQSSSKYLNKSATINPTTSEPRPRRNPNAPPLMRLLKSPNSEETAAFGSIRFPARSLPAKYVHISPDSKAGDVVGLMLDTWKLATPCAVLALPPPSTSGATDGGELGWGKGNVMSRLDLILRRGLAEAARKTNAWIFTCGEVGNHGAQTAGRAMVHAANAFGEESACTAVVASDRMREAAALATLQNGKVHRYGTPAPSAVAAAAAAAAGTAPATSDSLDSSDSSPAAAADAARRELFAAGGGRVDIDPHHSHIIVVDGGAEQAAELRDRLEFYISSQDLSDDGIQTPKLLVVISGDASTLECVRIVGVAVLAVPQRATTGCSYEGVGRLEAALHATREKRSHRL